MVARALEEGNTPTVTVINDSTNAMVANITDCSWWTTWGVAYDSGKGEIFAGNVVISDSNNTVVAQVPEALGSAVYDPAKGEIIGAGPTVLDVISDSAVLEFSSAALILVLFLTVSVVVVLASKKSIRPRSRSMLTTK